MFWMIDNFYLDFLIVVIIYLGLSAFLQFAQLVQHVLHFSILGPLLCGVSILELMLKIPI
jgi:hypothetical protein